MTGPDGLAARPHQDPEAAERRVAKAVAKGRAGDWLRTEISDHDDNLSLRWWRDSDALAEAERRDGLYALVTNMSARQCSPDRPLALYGDQSPLRARPPLPQGSARGATRVLEVQPPRRGQPVGDSPD